jgi:serine/threonine-protein kinase
MPELTQIAHYQIVEAIASSGKVRAYRAKDLRSGRDVVLKTVTEDAKDPENTGLIARLKNESQTGAKLRHSGIVEVYEYGEDSGVAYVATEFLEGCALQARLRIPLADAGSLIIQLLSALQYAHEQDVLHLNLTPANLVLTSKGKLKVGGFGGPQTGPADSAYRSPEQLAVGSIGRASDIFSAGALFYEWLAGVSAFPGPTERLRDQISGGQEKPVSQAKPSLSPVFDEVCGRSLAKSPRARHPNARAFRDEICAAYEEATGKPPQDLVSNETAVSAFLSSLRTESRKNRVRQSSPRPQPSAPPSAAPSLFPMETMRAVEKDLAPFLGPLARIVVKEAASKAEDLKGLYELAAESLGTQEERAGFLSRSPGGRPVFQEEQDVHNDATATSLDISSDALLSAMATPPPDPEAEAPQFDPIAPEPPKSQVVPQPSRNTPLPANPRVDAAEPRRPDPAPEIRAKVDQPAKIELDPKIAERLEDLLGKQPETLAAYLAETPPELEQVIYPFKSSAEALMRLYESNGKTNGLSPQNIVFDRMGVATIETRIAGGGTTLGVLGSPRYTAPEILADKGGDASPTAADIYSLGFIFYEILLGRKQFRTIFRQENDLDWLRWHADRSKVAPALRSQLPDHPAALSDLLQSMLEKDPAKRTKDAATVVSRLRSIAQQASRTLVRKQTATVISKPKAPEPEVVVEPAKTKKRRSVNMNVVMIVVAIVLLLAVLGLLLFLSQKTARQRSDQPSQASTSAGGPQVINFVQRFSFNNKQSC